MESVIRRLTIIESHLHDTLSIGTDAPLQARDAAATSPALGVDPEKMSKFLYPDHRDLRSQVKEFFADPFFRHQFTGSFSAAEHQQLSFERLKKIVEKQFFSIYDLRTDPLKYFAFFESFMCNDMGLAMKLVCHYNMFGVAILNLGSNNHQKYLKDIDGRGIWGCYAMTELGHGSNIRNLETVATFDPVTGGFTLNTPGPSAQKWLVGNLTHATHAVVFAQLVIREHNYGVHGFVVTLRDSENALAKGVHIKDLGHKEGLNGLDTGRIWFEDVFVPRENLLDKYCSVAPDGTYSSPITNADQRLAAHLDEMMVSRMIVGIGALDAAKLGLTICIQYCNTRRQNGPVPKLSKNSSILTMQPSVHQECILLDYPIIRLKLFPCLVENYALIIFSNYCKALFQQHQQPHLPSRQHDIPEAELNRLYLMVAALKITATTHANKALQTCRECCGGQGYLSQNLISVLKRDVEAFTTIDGDNQILIQQIAKELLSVFKKKVATSVGALKQVRENLVLNVIDKNPINSRIYSAAHLRNPDFHVKALNYREQLLVQSLAKRVWEKDKSKSKTDGGKKAFEMWKECQVHMTKLGKAYAERVIYEQFAKTAKQCLDPKLKAVLNLMCSLYGLCLIEWDPCFVRNRFVSPTKSKAISAQIELLCMELQPHVIQLVKSYGFPPHLLAGTVAQAEEGLFDKWWVAEQVSATE